MTTHLGLMVVFAMFVAAIFATIAKDTPREQFRLVLKLLGGFIGTALALGWIMRVFPL